MEQQFIVVLSVDTSLDDGLFDKAPSAETIETLLSEDVFLYHLVGNIVTKLQVMEVVK